MGLQGLDAGPLFDHRDHVRPGGRLRPDAGGHVDHGGILQTALLCEHLRHDPAELRQEGLAAAFDDFNGGDDADHGRMRDEVNGQVSVNGQNGP